ncbi:MAG: hypothetical protein O3C17_06870 [Planctomycetota bacterium]|nr:hypothetical protein [Planctomycetota bacterium]
MIPTAGVTQREVLTGKLGQQGYPVLLVKPDLPDAQWWVQEHATVEADGRFQVQARFGNEETPPGTQFKVVVLVLQNREELQLWEPGDVIEKLPALVPRSKEEAATVRKVLSEVEIIEDVVSSPRAGTDVNRVAAISGQMKEHHPVVLVRSAEPNSPWWGQSPVKVDSKTKKFTGRLVFGSRTTQDESRFRIVVLALKRPTDLQN